MKQQHIHLPKGIRSYDIQYTPNQSDSHCVLPWIQWIQGLGRIQLDGGLLARFQFVKLNFSHNETSDASLDFVDLEAFGANNFEKSLIRALLVHLKKRKFCRLLDFEKLFLIGHSKGGATLYVCFVTSRNCFCQLVAVIDPVALWKGKDKLWKKKTE
jgi:hypothetical protein